jgi:agmatine deiminase
MNRRDLLLFAGLLLCASGLGATVQAERSTDGSEELLPIDATPAERAIAGQPSRSLLANDPPPFAPVRNIAEYEPATGVLIRYPLGVGYGVIKEMAEDVTVFVIVSSEKLATAVSEFVANGVDTTQVDWVVAPTNSIWTRDYGPWFVFDGNGDQVIIDHYYNRPRPDDDVIPVVLGHLWNLPVVSHGMWHAGGNYMTEGHGLSFSSDLVWDENWMFTHDEIAQFWRDYYGVDDYEVIPDISETGIHHIDTWGKLLDEETVLMKQVDPSHVDYARIEANAATVAGLTDKYGRPFRVVRVNCPPIASGDVAAYTNAFILNNKVLVPTFGLPAADAAALQVYRNAMPGYEVLGFSGGWLTDDALHCRVIGIYDRHMLRVDHDPVQTASAGVPVPITMYADDRSEAGIDMSATKLYWRKVGAPTFSPVAFTTDDEPDWYRSQIPAQPTNTDVEYYVTARDLTGRASSRPRAAPLATYHVTFDGVTGTHPTMPPKLSLSVGPSPFRYRSVARFHTSHAGTASVAVYDVRGREVARLMDRPLDAGDHEIEWTGSDARGAQAPSGVYFVVLRSGGERVARRVVLLR